jgi:ubiquinone/menaquinone biosynthesis C-methylase UbiE
LFDIGLSDAGWKSYVDSLQVPPEIRDWVYRQLARGQDYYSSRIQRLGLRGRRVLDAGCGMGNWSLGLARWFQETHALEITANRLAILEGISGHLRKPIVTRLGSIEALPYPDAFFDAVFCNGVIFLTDYRKSLQEFARVLRPGGTLYVSFNGKAWWLHLLRERSKEDPVNYAYGANAFINRLFRLLEDDDSERRKLEGAVRDFVASRLLESFGGSSWRVLTGGSRRLARAYESYCSAPAGSERATGLELDLAAAVARASSGDSDPETLSVGALLQIFREPPHSNVARDVVAGYRRRAVRDVTSRALFGCGDHRVDVQTHCLEPGEMADELAQAGFAETQTGFEGTIVADASACAAAPIYDERLGVFEALARRA